MDFKDLLIVLGAAFGSWVAIKVELALLKTKVERAEKDIQVLFTISDRRNSS